MTHRLKNAPKPRAIVASPWYIRKAVYVVVMAVGLVAVALGLADPDQVDSWLTQSSDIVAQIIPLLTVVGGLVASVHTGPASDKSPAEEIADNLPAAPAPVQPEVTFTAYPNEVE